MTRLSALLLLALWLMGCDAAPAPSPSEIPPTSPPASAASPTTETTPSAPALSTPSIAPEPEALALPQGCIPQNDAEWSYVSPEGDYCLLYPEGFRVAQPGQTILEGAPLDEGPAPLMAMLHIERVSAEGETLSAATDGYLALAGAAGQSLVRAPATLGGEVAELIEGIPGRTGARHLFTLHDGMLYHLSIEPDPASFPQAAEHVEQLWQRVTTSFAFLPPEVSAIYAGCPTTTERAVGYVNALDGYCLLYPGLPFRVMAAVPSARMRTFAKPEFFDPQLPFITINVVGPAEGESVEEIVAGAVAEFDYGGDSTTTTLLTIGGEPALLVEGMPGLRSNRALYVVHEDWIYTILVAPYDDPGFADVQAEAEAAWEIVTGSFTFLP